MAIPGNQHCANCIGTLSFPIATVDSCRYEIHNLIIKGCCETVQAASLNLLTFPLCKPI